MEKIVDKLSSYNLLNNMVPGAAFCYLFNMIINVNILSNNIIENLFVYYFIGMIISRIGSLVIEPLAKKIKLVKFAPYKDFLRASSKDDKINILSETNNTYRTMFSMSISILLVKLYLIIAYKITVLKTYTHVLIIIFLIILFAFSYSKQTKYIKNRVNDCIEENE